MQALRWLYEQHIRDNPAAYAAYGGWRFADGGAARCYLCGAPCPDGAPSRPTKEAIPDTFMEQEIVRCAPSGWVCPACCHYLLDGVMPLVSFSHVITPTTTRRWERDVMRGDIEGWLADGEAGRPLGEPLVLAILTSAMKRRHVLPRAEVTTSGTRLSIRIDQRTVWVTPAEWRAISGPFDWLRATGHSKREILSGQLHPVALARDAAAGRLLEALALSAALAVWRGHPALDLVAFVSPAQVEQAEVVEQGEQEHIYGGGHGGMGAGGGGAVGLEAGACGHVGGGCGGAGRGEGAAGGRTAAGYRAHGAWGGLTNHGRTGSCSGSC